MIEKIKEYEGEKNMILTKTVKNVQNNIKYKIGILRF